MSKRKQGMTCRICSSETSQRGLLHICSKSNCSAVHWDKKKIRPMVAADPAFKAEALNENFVTILEDANVPDWVSGKHYVYTIRLRGQRPQGSIGKLYVGMTGLHPYARYLNHIRGYQSASCVRRYGTALVTNKGPISYEEAKTLEPLLAGELREQGYDVHGGH